MSRMFTSLVLVTVSTFASVYGGGLYGSGTYNNTPAPTGGSGSGSSISSQPTTYNTPKTTNTSPTSGSTIPDSDTSSPISPGPLSQEQPPSKPLAGTNTTQTNNLKTWFFAGLTLLGLGLLFIVFTRRHTEQN